MQDWLQLAVGLTGGGGITGLATWWRSRHRERVDAAEKLTTMAVNLLAPYEREQARQAAEMVELRNKIATVERELVASQREQGRLADLFGQAVRALRDLIDIARRHGDPVPVMSPELAAEIERRPE